jgi:S1-C subfamily serine protease
MLSGSGTGFFAFGGKIITNFHVIQDAAIILVHLEDDRILKAEVVGTAPDTDVAVLQVRDSELPPDLHFSQTAPGTGELALAIGYPLGLDQTLTLGVVSNGAVSARKIGNTDSDNYYLQTDAAINPGNSGGPLFNYQGNIIGMNTMMIRNTEGLGFALQADLIKLEVEDILVNSKKDSKMVP